MTYTFDFIQQMVYFGALDFYTFLSLEVPSRPIRTFRTHAPPPGNAWLSIIRMFNGLKIGTCVSNNHVQAKLKREESWRMSEQG